MTFRVYLGYDPREQAAYRVAKQSILRRAADEVLVQPLGLAELARFVERPVERRGQQLWCPVSDAPMSTEFAIARFAVPFLCSEGWALFADCDIVCRADISELFALADPQYAVMCVQHGSLLQTGTKMDGQIQTTYNRKNWSSVVLWNVNHESHRSLTHKALQLWPGRYLHAFRWLADREIGALPGHWNHLVGIDPPEQLSQAKILHYTLGGPFTPGWQGGPADELWNEERAGPGGP